jgi:hypothetical protein
MQKVAYGKKLKKILDKEWQDVRKSFFYPQLPPPKLTRDIDNGKFDFKNLQVSINPDYIKKLDEKGCQKRTALHAILGHEVGHFVDYPGNVLTLLKMHRVAREDLFEQQANLAKDAFTNIQNNTNLVQNRDFNKIVKTLRAEAPEATGLNRVILGLYQKLWKRRLGVRLNKSEKEMVDRLAEIDYLNRDYLEYNFKKFIRIVHERLGQYRPHGDSPPIAMFDKNLIKEGIKQFARTSLPGEFERTVKEVLRKEKGLKAGTIKGEMIIAENFYSALAEDYPVPIRKKKTEKDGSLYPYSHEEFSIDDTIDDLDPFSSDGIIPGVTQKWLRKDAEVVTDYSKIPDSLIIIDSSGSMPHPDQRISIPVLGATVIANAYLDNDARVAVYNFSADNIIAGFSKSKLRLHRVIRTYQAGGTVFSTEDVHNLVKKQESLDISIISDMNIRNLDEFVSYIANLPNVHRIHLFYTHSSRIQDIATKLYYKENVAVLPLKNEEDIRRIVQAFLKMQ